MTDVLEGAELFLSVRLMWEWERKELQIYGMVH